MSNKFNEFTEGFPQTETEETQYTELLEYKPTVWQRICEVFTVIWGVICWVFDKIKIGLYYFPWVLPITVGIYFIDSLICIPFEKLTLPIFKNPIQEMFWVYVVSYVCMMVILNKSTQHLNNRDKYSTLAIVRDTWLTCLYGGIAFGLWTLYLTDGSNMIIGGGVLSLLLCLYIIKKLFNIGPGLSVIGVATTYTPPNNVTYNEQQERQKMQAELTENRNRQDAENNRKRNTIAYAVQQSSNSIKVGYEDGHVVNRMGTLVNYSPSSITISLNGWTTVYDSKFSRISAHPTK